MADMAEKSKPKGALVALLAGDPSGEDDESGDLAPSDHGFRAVAKAFGIPPEREASAQAALKQYIKACAGSASESDEEY
jgi:hypothetical protein